MIMWLKSLLSQYTSFLSSDLYANILTFFYVLAAFLLLIIGSTEVIAEFKKRRRRAVFSYYSGLRHYFLRLKTLILDNNNKPQQNLFKMGKDDIKTSETELRRQRICDFSEKFLDYLSTKDEQVPPVNTYKGWENWDEQVKSLTKHLDSLISLGKGYAFSDFLENDIKEGYINDSVTDLIRLITEMEKSIMKVIVDFYKDMKDENRQDKKDSSLEVNGESQGMH